MKHPAWSSRLRMTCVLLLCCIAVSAQVPPPTYNSPRTAPTQPQSGQSVQFLINWDGCGTPGAVSNQVAGNVITIVQTLDAICGVPPPSPPLSYVLGAFAPGQYVVRYSIVTSSNALVFGPIDEPFTVVGGAQPIPALDIQGTVLLMFVVLLTGTIIVKRRRSPVPFRKLG